MRQGGDRLKAVGQTERERLILAAYDAHIDTIYRYVFRRCRDHTLAEDITQETFMVAVRDSNDPSKLTIQWLQTVARNKLFDVLRRNVRYEEKLRLVANSVKPLAEADPTERLRVEQALEALPVHYRLVLTLHYLNGMPIGDIAKQLDRTLNSVEGLMRRARQSLAAELEPESTNKDAGEAK